MPIFSWAKANGSLESSSKYSLTNASRAVVYLVHFVVAGSETVDHGVRGKNLM